MPNELWEFIKEADPNRVALALNASRLGQAYEVDVEQGTIRTKPTRIYRLYYRAPSGEERAEYISDAPDPNEARRLQARLDELRKQRIDAAYDVFYDNSGAKPRAYRAPKTFLEENKDAIAAAIQYLAQRRAQRDEQAAQDRAEERKQERLERLLQLENNLRKEDPDYKIRVAQAERTMDAVGSLRQTMQRSDLPEAVRTAIAAALESGDIDRAQGLLRGYEAGKTLRPQVDRLPSDLAHDVLTAIESGEDPREALRAAQDAARRRAAIVADMLSSKSESQVRAAIELLRQQPQLKEWASVPLRTTLESIEDRNWYTDLLRAAESVADIWDRASWLRDTGEFLPTDITSSDDDYRQASMRAASILSQLAASVDPRVDPRVVRAAIVSALVNAGFQHDTAAALVDAALPHLRVGAEPTNAEPKEE